MLITDIKPDFAFREFSKFPSNKAYGRISSENQHVLHNGIISMVTSDMLGNQKYINIKSHKVSAFLLHVFQHSRQKDFLGLSCPLMSIRVKVKY